ncbi:MAG: hemerythrin domain-containing protein [Gammaproteobacteria bacterium]|nr:hemerythrin domain-containing protein [Gammaproteobacteria bacterium]MCW8841163.1 hemerythrin domain-containing protein [Gammaproteobacteria bacterium]MCW8973562.1 hemerythrin domain-containing protein [Gammaproteobacteria bacterium]MCW8993659.1 hemerythrin domain-containing protein [Gammaproteobacteria bacterium]
MGSMISHFLNRWQQFSASSKQAMEYQSAPGTGIRYSPTLVDELKADHQQFFKLHEMLLEALRGERLEEVPILLHRFDTLLTSHLLTEQVRLYAYMDAYFTYDTQAREMLRDYRIEMEKIGNSVRKMIKKYKDIANRRELQETVEKDMDELRQVLDERMSREESTLYPLYMPITDDGKHG